MTRGAGTGEVPYKICVRTNRRPVAVVLARSATEACSRAAEYLSKEITMPNRVKALRAVPVSRESLPRGLPWFDGDYFQYVLRRNRRRPFLG